MSAPENVLKTADFLILLTDWKEFIDCPISKFQQLTDKVIFDGRNCFNPVVMHKYGITYITIGRNNVGHDLVMASRRAHAATEADLVVSVNHHVPAEL